MQNLSEGLWIKGVNKRGFGAFTTEQNVAVLSLVDGTKSTEAIKKLSLKTT